MAKQPIPAPQSNELINADLLAARHGSILETMADFERREFPERADSDEEVAPILDEIKALDKFGSDTVEATRLVVKGPFANAVEVTDAFFFGVHSPRRGSTPGRLQKRRAYLLGIASDYSDRKEARERERLDQIAKQQREEEERARLKAEEERAKQAKAEQDDRTRAAANAGARAATAEAEASIAGARAFEAEQQAAAKPAELARVRTESGALASPKVEWKFTVASYDAVKGQHLWQYATAKEKDAMIARYVKANAPERLPPGGDDAWQPLIGVRMVSTRKLQVR